MIATLEILSLLFSTVTTLIAAVPGGAPAFSGVADVHGAWAAETYHLRDGSVHEVRGHILFTEHDWSVLFFVLDENGQPIRGSAEGGTYTLDGEDLVFTHLHNLSTGSAVGSLPETPLRMVTRPDGHDAPTEATRAVIDGGRLTLHFPSGNRMVFGRR